MSLAREMSGFFSQVKPEHLLDQCYRYTLFAGPATPPIEQAVVAMLFVPLPPPPICRSLMLMISPLPSVDLLRHRSQDHFLYLHRSTAALG